MAAATEVQLETTSLVPSREASRPTVITSDWRARLPLLSAAGVTLRELRYTDAASLLAHLSTEEVARFLSPPPTTVEGYVRFIEWTHRERRAGRHVCFGIVPDGMNAAVGLIQVRALGARWETAEWGFALGSTFWGSGIFASGAILVVRFAFEQLEVHRLEARAVVQNGRGNAALLKVGARQEAVLHQSFRRRGEYFDQGLWTILRDEWRGTVVARRGPRAAPVVIH